MDVIIIVLMTYFAIRFVRSSIDALPEQVKKCKPPHQWEWQDIVNESGEKQGERIVCKKCGPINLDENWNF